MEDKATRCQERFLTRRLNRNGLYEAAPRVQEFRVSGSCVFVTQSNLWSETAPRALFDKFSLFLLNFGFICSVKDPSLFIYRHNKVIIYLLLYVDDMILTGNDPIMVERLLASLSKEFRMKDMGSLSYFLGIQVKHTSTGLFLNQELYATDLLENAGMLDCAPMPTPLPLQLDRVPHQDEMFSDPTYFRSLAGKLQYLTLTRPDLQFVVNLVCQRMHKPTMADFHILKRVLRYIK